MKNIAVIVDWENIRKGVFELAGKPVNKGGHGWFVDYNNVENIKKYINAFVDFDTEELYRIFFYTACFEQTQLNNNPQFIKQHLKTCTLLNSLYEEDYTAIRLGSLVLRPNTQTPAKPFVNQKKVDMLIGLDIAHFSYQRLVDRVLILCHDADIIPAMKIARTNGIQVVFGYPDDLITNMKTDLLKHSDIIRKKSFKQIFNIT